MKCAIIFRDGVPDVVIVAPDADGVAMSVIEKRKDTDAVICVFEMESISRPDGSIALMDNPNVGVKTYSLKTEEQLGKKDLN